MSQQSNRGQTLPNLNW